MTLYTEIRLGFQVSFFSLLFTFGLLQEKEKRMARVSKKIPDVLLSRVDEQKAG